MTATTPGTSASGIVTAVHRNDRSSVSGPDISLEPYYMNIRTTDGEKPVPYHRILLITYEGKVEFENRKVQGLAYQLMGESRHEV